MTQVVAVYSCNAVLDEKNNSGAVVSACSVGHSNSHNRLVISANGGHFLDDEVVECVRGSVTSLVAASVYTFIPVLCVHILLYVGPWHCFGKTLNTGHWVPGGRGQFLICFSVESCQSCQPSSSADAHICTWVHATSIR